MSTKFHKGELQAQDRAGTRGVAFELGSGILNSLSFSRNHDAWLASQSFAVVASVQGDKEGTIWVTPVFGRPGFLQAPNEHEIRIQTDSIMTMDPLHEALKVNNMPLSMLGIDLFKRTRHRINGKSVLTRPRDPKQLRFGVLEYSPNCPKYLNRRQLHLSDTADPVEPNACRVLGPALTREDTSMISRMDTLFVGSCYDGGADVNHRGGKPGFVRQLSPTTIQWPEYRGNGTFFTSGNLEVNSAAGVTFIDFDNGDALQLSGTAVVDWHHKGSLDGATRAITFEIRNVIRTYGATSHRWKLLDYSPYNPDIVSADKENDPTSSGLFPVSVVLTKIVQESSLVKTFRWVAPKSIPFLPGQYATFEFPAVPGSPEPSHVRTWTLSETPNSIRGDNTLDISVKLKPGGAISIWLHRHAVVGETKVTLHGIDGDMTPIKRRDNADSEKVFEAPSQLLLLSAGIGITPALSIVRGMGAFELQSQTIITMIHVERHRSELIFQEELMRRAQNYKDFTLINIIASEEGRLTEERLRGLVPFGLEHQEVYICGPGKFMSDMTEYLVRFGAQAAKIHTEAFDF